MKLLQPSFGGGEYAPALRGRADLARFGISGKQFRNFIVRPTGGFESRPGTVFVAECKYSDKATRLLPFAVSETLAYVVELGHLYARFHYRGAPVMSGGSPVEVATPWTEAEVWAVKYTQSADVMFLTHGAHPPQLLQRTSATAFTLTEFEPREGPFRSLNSDESLVVSSSARSGTVTITANFDLFTAGMVGSLMYLEPKALGNLKPWAQGERSYPGGALAVGVLRRSDGKVYKATTVAARVGAQGYTECGNVRPTHEIGKEWDGPGDQRVFDTITYTVGVEWEYQHSGYGIVQIDTYNGPRSITGTVKKTLPQEVVGGVGTASSSWTLSGDGTRVVFPIFGASSLSETDYAVTINGAPVQSDPNYTPGGGGNVGTGGIRSPGTYIP